MSGTVMHGDCLEVMGTLDVASVDAIVTDPPYGLGFMGKAWDHGVPGIPFWTAALSVAKPGAHLVAFGGTRTYHHLTCAIEDAGWEIRDCLSWLYGSGFPKSHNGPWGGTALKPGWEPIILARRPLAGTVEANHAKHGTGALNIDACRINPGAEVPGGGGLAGGARSRHDGWQRPSHLAATATDEHTKGRWPANVVLDEAAAGMLDEQSGDVKGAVSNGRKGVQGIYRDGVGAAEQVPSYGDTGGASRFFYTGKASRTERNAGVERNHHPTVKPLDLMQWLCRLVTPKPGLILDPFCGSGTTGRAAVAEGFQFIGIEKEAEYVEIARARIAEYAPLFGGAA